MTGNPLGIGFVGVSLAFGLTVLTGAYALGHISGGHFNPAVSFGLWAGGRFAARDLLPYIVAQVVGGIFAGFILLQIASGNGTFTMDPNAAGAFASNGYGALSPGGYSVAAAFLCEVVMTAMFLVVILGATSARAPAGFAPIAIGLALTLIHLISIPVTNTSVNPARSTGVGAVRRRGGDLAAVAVLAGADPRRPARRLPASHARSRLIARSGKTTATSRDVAVCFCRRRGGLEAAFLKVDERLHDFLLRVHDERPVKREETFRRCLQSCPLSGAWRE